MHLYISEGTFNRTRRSPSARLHAPEGDGRKSPLKKPFVLRSPVIAGFFLFPKDGVFGVFSAGSGSSKVESETVTEPDRRTP